MRIMKLLAVVICLAVATPVLANPSTATHGAGYDGGMVWVRQAPGFTGNGGAFQIIDADDPGWPLDLSAYSSKVKGETDYTIGGNTYTDRTYFESFCVEKFEFVQSPMGLWVSTENAEGTQPGSHAWLGGKNTTTGDDLDPKTAYLYTKFAQGTLTDYAWTNPVNGLTRAQTGQALQSVMWTYEQENDKYQDLSYHGSIRTLQMALIDTWSAEAGGATSIGDVRVLQAYVGDYYKQDQLYLVPVPGAALLVVIGLGLVGWVKRCYA